MHKRNVLIIFFWELKSDFRISLNQIFSFDILFKFPSIDILEENLSIEILLCFLSCTSINQNKKKRLDGNTKKVGFL